MGFLPTNFLPPPCNNDHFDQTEPVFLNDPSRFFPFVPRLRCGFAAIPTPPCHVSNGDGLMVPPVGKKAVPYKVLFPPYRNTIPHTVIPSLGRELAPREVVVVGGGGSWTGCFPGLLPDRNCHLKPKVIFHYFISHTQASPAAHICRAPFFSVRFFINCCYHFLLREIILFYYKNDPCHSPLR